ncbi:Protein SERAC1 [Babesia microti strain RI]|uniref:Protein SERAC1 n=1 Tax=Babesia microti (strain RI) TaxID=1133968 RepID=A0A0K3ANN8_BABMR|nr:Protein SERAC1 [Babesia microti strain RI]CTQ41142.1 Protein SERAC1 [Babesia microti strain RI]|eukprot:XP_012649153.1 Protein SERAC1 [Babesia microti strain RI]
MNKLNTNVRHFGCFNVKTTGPWTKRGRNISLEYPALRDLLELNEDQRLEKGVNLSKQILNSKIPNWDYLTCTLQIVSDGAIKNKDIALRDILVHAINISGQSAIDGAEGKSHNNCPSRIYYESLRGLANYHNTTNSYPLGIYPIYLPNYTLDPLAKYSGIPHAGLNKPLIDVVIIHGVCGSPFRTWRLSKAAESNDLYKKEVPRDICWYWLWPRELLAREFPNVRIIAIEYYSQFLKAKARFPWANRFGLERKIWVQGEWVEDFQTLESGNFTGLANKFCKKLRRAGVGNNPLLILGHSFGGLLTQLMLLSDPELMNNLHAIVGYAVPYLGSSHGTNPRNLRILKLIGMEFTDTIKKICDDTFINHLLNNFSKLIEKRLFKIYTFEETIETRVTRLGINTFIVEHGKANPPFTDQHFRPLHSCHNDVCKPNGKDDVRYKPIAEIIHKLTLNRQ